MDNETDDKLANARASALATYESIVDMVDRLKAADDDDAYEEIAEALAKAEDYRVSAATDDGGNTGYCWGKDRTDDTETYETEAEAWLACCNDNSLRPDAEAVRQEIEEDPLSVEIRSGWYSPGETPEPEEYTILLGTGGPAVRIIGELDQYCQPRSARLQCQDWFTPWTDVLRVSQDTLLAYAACFYYGE